MSANDQLEREVEAALARLATDAVPDARRAPVPPWREQERRSRVADVRRFGRATPWLIAAVLLVIAGLGIGAGVAFDSSAPDRAPVGTQPPDPSATITAPDGTLGTPTTSPSSHPTFSRTSNGTAPDDGVGAFIAGIGSYGPVRVGMTRAEAQSALGLGSSDTTPGYGTTCKVAVPMPGTADQGRSPRAIFDDSTGGTVIGFETASDATDAFGNGEGSTLAQLKASYPTGQLVVRQGWTFTVLDGSGSGLGFQLDTTFESSGQPADTDRVTFMIPGTASYASGDELCVG